MPTDILIDIAIKDAELGMSPKRHAQAILQFVFLGLSRGTLMEHSAKH
jgi:hypothetical protein